MSENTNSNYWAKFCGTLLLAIGVLLLLQTLELIPWEFWEFIGPGLLIIFGIAILKNPGSFMWCCCCFPHYERTQSK